MKFFEKIVWLVLAFHLLLLVYVISNFQVDDTTLSKGDVYSFDHDWIMTQQGESFILEELPYLGESEPGEQVVIENTIPREYFGLTMSFLSADKTIKVWMDGECVYEFGVSDVRSFGKTPGSIVNFIDIPDNLSEGKIRIEMCSPYDDYGARISSITIGKRDVLILKLWKDNILHIACNLVILICGIIFFLLFLIQKKSEQDTDGLQYLCGYCIVTSLYYFIETKTLHIFYGNQTLYSVMVFLCLMMIPFYIVLYYGNGILCIYEKRWKVLLGLACVNIFVQMVLQLLNVVDFMNMAFVSHTLITLTVVIVAKSFLDIMKEKREFNVMLELAALLFMGGGGAVDIVRMYIVAVGDMGKFSRLGTTFFSMIMLYKHFNQVRKGYAHNVEENARLLKHEMEYMEKKNKQLSIANELAEEARLEALAANAAKRKFLAHMSHEIRTPINAVLGMNTMILRETSDMQIKEYALDIQNAGQNLLSLINDILDFSKIESGKLEIVQAEYDFNSLIHDISNMMKGKADSKRLELRICIDEGLPSRMLGDDVRIRQILINLLNNAVKYTQKGTVTLRVDGKIEGRKVILYFAVEDTGIGIKEEDISKLFKEFERIEEKRNRNIEGTGLGINITTQLLALMGSRLQVESVYGEGSRFYFTLEQQIVDATPVGNLEERLKRQSTEYTYIATFVAPTAQILTVDDNATNLKVFVNLLKRTRVNVDVADSGKACLEMVAGKRYDLIFLDHMMPEMDGIETLRRMKKLEENKCRETPVVALTANAISGAKEMYLSEGFQAFLPKPINPEKLEQMILKLLPRELLQFDEEDEPAAVSGVGSLADRKGTGQADKAVSERTDGYDSLLTDEAGELPIVDGVDWSYGLMHLPDRELLMDTVTDFYKVIDAEADALERFYLESREKPDKLEQYRIKVHSMKSTANLIGATMLGGMAKVLENAARDADIDTVEALNDIFLKEWRSYKEKLQECVPASVCGKEQTKAEVQDQSLIRGLLEMLETAMEEMDVDEMDRIMEQLTAFQYSSEIQADIDKLGALVINLESEQAASLIEKLIKRSFE